MDWSTACPDWEARIVDRQQLIPCSPLFPGEASEALEVMKQLRIVDLPGRPTVAEVTRPWILDFASSIFGSYDPESGRREIKEFFLMISKKNSKSTTAAEIMLTALLRNWRHNAEYLILAPTKEIADNSFQPAAAMCRADDELIDLMHVQDHIRTITHRPTGATLKVVAADNETVGGKKATGVLIDELWIFGKRPNAENMFREATGGLASRPEGFVIYLTTQSDEPPAGIFKQKLDYARDVRDGKINDKRFLPVIYEFPKHMLEAEAYKDKGSFYVTNPNLGASVDEDFIEREYDKALSAGDGSLQGFYAKHLNVEIGTRLRNDRWEGADYWDARADESLRSIDALIERSEVVVAGVDGGGLDDLFGLCLLGRERGTRRYLVWVHAWCHRGVLTRRKSIAARLYDYEKNKELTIVDDELRDVTDIVEKIAAVDQAGLLHAVMLDTEGPYGELVDALAEIGVTAEENGRIKGVKQGIFLMGAIKGAARKVANGTLIHGGTGLMAWVVGNLKIERTPTAIRATKQNAGDAKVDPAFAMFDAFSEMVTNPGQSEIYSDDREIRFV